MKTKYLFIAFVVTALLQVFVPLKMVYDSEITEREGAIYKFKTAPVDPTDAFRGKYVALDFVADTLATQDSVWAYREEIYATVANSNDGYAKITSVNREVPESGDYIKVTVRHHSNNTLYFNLPFNRLYMEESKAHEAETEYNVYNDAQNNNSKKPAYALVAVKDGNSVLKDVIIDGIPLRQYVLKQRKAEK